MPDFVRSGGVTMGNAVIEVKADSDGNPTECCNPVTGVCLNGGGGGDFSIAEVTFTRDAGGGSFKDVPELANGWLTVSAVISDAGVFEMVVPNNGATAMRFDKDGSDIALETTGDVQTTPIPDTEYIMIIVTGDCTINVVSAVS